jgi:orotate phosphoribosyltransferase-like protein
LTTYIEKNLEIALKIIELHDTGLSKLKVSEQLGVSWDKVKYSVLHREDFLAYATKAVNMV